MAIRSAAKVMFIMVILSTLASADFNSTNTTQDLKQQTTQFMTQAESVFPYPLLFGYAVAATLYALFARGGNKSGDALMKLGGIVVVIFFALWALGTL